ncbi:YwqI/YxiC family protein [Sporosarcina sp. E16_8]|uniref:YwqI/YxiC family protein n=1 Tax=Sporosarcina sp. E16_8 TaxID=2789295 RepID=UPI001A92F303|nr:YwqI/YxiC family protein [Sporosarcina sp. E16_8]MBO0589179.1 YwqI/YxiC family protein [Sporosarcina sp. E16_8]
MSTEVKIIYADVESKIGDMTNATTLLGPKAEPPITGNTLDVVTKLTELSTKLDTLLTSYQKVLLANSVTTTNSVQFMRESDEKVASVMEGTLSGPKMVTQ